MSTRPGPASLIKVGWIDRLNVEDVLRVLTSTNVKVRIVLKGDTDQIGDRVLRGLAQVFPLLGISRGCRNQTCDRQRQSQESDTQFAAYHRWSPTSGSSRAHQRTMFHKVECIPDPHSSGLSLRAIRKEQR
jgi:hypothetical protein